MINLNIFKFYLQKLNLLKFSSLRTRVTLFTLSIFLLGIWFLSFYAIEKLRENMRQQLGHHQLMLASLLAKNIDFELRERIQVLEKIAEKITPAMFKDATALQLLLEDQLVIARYFNTGAYVTGTDGRAIAAVPKAVRRIGVNYLERGYIVTALKHGRSNIGQPVIGTVLRSPVFPIAVPIKDAQGKVIGVLAGIVDLGQANFLDKFTESRYGASGYFLLEEPASRLIITGTNKTRVMQKLPLPGVNKLIDRHVQGYEETGITVNPLGVEVLASAKRIPTANWFIVAALPTQEAFAPIYDLQRNIIMVTILMTLLAGSLTWWMLRRELMPIVNTAKKLTELSKLDSCPQPLQVTGRDEIGKLIKSFNRLLTMLSKREEQLQESEFRWKFAIDGSGDGLWDWDIVSGTVFFSKKWKSMLGFEEHEITNNLFEWANRVHPADKDAVLADVKNHLEGRSASYLNEHRVLCKNNTYKWILDRGLVVSRDPDGKPLRMIGTHSDITVRKEMETQVRHMALYDVLTQLPNRRLLIDRIDRAIANSKRNQKFGALMFLDLDNFKSLNDSHGHVAGDMLLIELASRLKSCVRDTDTVARIGGDEFVIMLPELNADRKTSKAEASLVANKILHTFYRPYLLALKNENQPTLHIEHKCSASIGVVMFISDRYNQDEIMRRADSAMYQAKAAGRNCIKFYTSKTDAIVLNRT